MMLAEALEPRRLFAVLVTSPSPAVMQLNGDAQNDAITLRVKPDGNGNGLADVILDIGGGEVLWETIRYTDQVDYPVLYIWIFTRGGNDQVIINLEAPLNGPPI